MDRRKLIYLLLLVLPLWGCQSDMDRLNSAAAREGAAAAAAILPDLPAACTAKVERVRPKVGEKARWTQKRWEFSAEKRDGQSRDCQSFWDDYKQRIAAE